MIEVLTSLSAWQVFLLAVGGTIAVTVAAAAVIHRTLHGQPRERAGITAAAYMTALGSLFAILTGFLISSEFLTLRSAQNAVGTEVAAASQLAQASGALVRCVELASDVEGHVGTAARVVLVTECVVANLSVVEAEGS